MAEDAPGAVVVLVTAGVASATSAVSDRPPTLGGSVASGAGTALFVGGATMDARPPSSSAARGGAIRMVVAAGSGPGVVWLISLLFFFLFSSFFSSASLERKRGKGG
jgi:hypothetical protein